MIGYGQRLILIYVLPAMQNQVSVLGATPSSLADKRIVLTARPPIAYRLNFSSAQLPSETSTSRPDQTGWAAKEQPNGLPDCMICRYRLNRARTRSHTQR